jgi:two-component system response regulator FlrC
VFPLHIPPLRERRADILPIANRLLRKGSEAAQGKAFSLSNAAAAGLTAHTWRGNIRELENVLQRAMILAPGAVIEAEQLCLPKPAADYSGTLGATAEAKAELPTDLKSRERAHILETLAAVNGVRKAAAERLGMSERTLRYKLQQYRMEQEGKTGEAQPDNPEE